MGTNIFLGNPPTNVEQWIKNHYGPKCDALCFTAEEAPSTVKLTKANVFDNQPEVYLQTSTDGTQWNDYTVNDTIQLAKVGDKVYFKAKYQNTQMAVPYGGYYSYHNFEMTGKIAASGNVNSLLMEDEKTARTLSLSGRDACYFSLFNGCRSLTTAPELPSTTLAGGCYSSMFEGCTSLTTAPAILPATTLADNCYNGMFKGCTSLTQAPELPATTLASYCYISMFYWCSNLNTIKLGYTDNFVDNYFGNWVEMVASKGTFYYNGSDTTQGVSAIPSGWTVSGWSVNGK